MRMGWGLEAEVHTNTCNTPSKMSFAALCPATKALMRLIASPVTSFFLIIVAGGALPAAAAATASLAPDFSIRVFKLRACCLGGKKGGQGGLERPHIVGENNGGRGACLNWIGNHSKPSRQIKESGGCRRKGSQGRESVRFVGNRNDERSGGGQERGVGGAARAKTWGEPAQFTVKSPADAAAPAGVQEKRREDPDWEMIWPKVEGEFSLRESTTPMTAVRVAGMNAPGAHTLPGIGSKVGEGRGRCREYTRSSDRGRGCCCKSRAKKRRGRNSDENNSLRLGVDHSGASFDGRAEARREAAAAAGWREQNKGAVLPAAHGGEHIGRDDWPLRAGGAAGKDDTRVGGDGGGVGDDAH